jgi:hypothetical protein
MMEVAPSKRAGWDVSSKEQLNVYSENGQQIHEGQPG